MAFYLVTGGCGFIGSHLVDALLKAGHRVRVLDDFSSGHRANLAPSATLMIGDIREPGTVRRALEDIDGCFHLAAIASSSRYEKEWRCAHEVNLAGALNVFRESSKARNDAPIPIVFASSAAVYGEARSLPIAEVMAVSPINAYGADKAACELHARTIAHSSGMPITSLRFFNVYGPRQDPASIYSGVISIFCDQLLRGEPVDIYGDGHQTRDLIYVSDVVEYLLRAMVLADGGVYNVCTGTAVSIIDLAKLIAEFCGTDLKVRSHAARIGDIRHSAGDPSRAAAQFGYRAMVDLRTGLAQTIAALRATEPVVRRSPVSSEQRTS